MDFTELKTQLSALKPDELQTLVKGMEEDYGITVSSSESSGFVGVVMPTVGPAPVQTEFTVELTGLTEASKKIGVIKIVRELTNLDLKAAKDLVDGAPKNILENISREQADDVKAKLEAAGAKVEVK